MVFKAGVSSKKDAGLGWEKSRFYRKMVETPSLSEGTDRWRGRELGFA